LSNVYIPFYHDKLIMVFFIIIVMRTLNTNKILMYHVESGNVVIYAYIILY